MSDFSRKRKLEQTLAQTLAGTYVTQHVQKAEQRLSLTGKDRLREYLLSGGFEKQDPCAIHHDLEKCGYIYIFGDRHEDYKKDIISFYKQGEKGLWKGAKLEAWEKELNQDAITILMYENRPHNKGKIVGAVTFKVSRVLTNNLFIYVSLMRKTPDETNIKMIGKQLSRCVVDYGKKHSRSICHILTQSIGYMYEEKENEINFQIDRSIHQEGRLFWQKWCEHNEIAIAFGRQLEDFYPGFLQNDCLVMYRSIILR